MSEEELNKVINEKYGPRYYWGARYPNREAFEKEYMTLGELFIATEWQEFGVTIVEVHDNNMWCEGVVIG